MLRAMSTDGSYAPGQPADWSSAREQLHARGLRWTPQRRTLIDVLSHLDGHVTGAELIERCRQVDPTTIPSTVYRTLDVLEELGWLRHSHRADGREEFHVQPVASHGHLHCRSCGETWEVPADEASGLIEAFRRSRGFSVDLSHLSIGGQCATCVDARGADAPGVASETVTTT
jgi:Fur family ferric uptake transcriptional regulator